MTQNSCVNDCPINYLKMFYSNEAKSCLIRCPLGTFQSIGRICVVVACNPGFYLSQDKLKLFLSNSEAQSKINSNMDYATILNIFSENSCEACHPACSQCSGPNNENCKICTSGKTFSI